MKIKLQKKFISLRADMKYQGEYFDRDDVNIVLSNFPIGKTGQIEKKVDFNSSSNYIISLWLNDSYDSYDKVKIKSITRYKRGYGFRISFKLI